MWDKIFNSLLDNFWRIIQQDYLVQIILYKIPKIALQFKFLPKLSYYISN